jgi:hypothetical protein
MHGAPHRGFAQVLAVLLPPPGAVLLQGGIGGRLHPRAQRRLLFPADRTRPAWDGLALQGAGLVLLDHGPFDRGHGHVKAASSFSHGLTLSHCSHQTFF